MNVCVKFYWRMFYMKILQNSHLIQWVTCCFFIIGCEISVLKIKLFWQPIIFSVKLHIQHLVIEEFDESSYWDLLPFDCTFGVLTNLTFLRKHCWDLCELNWLLFSCRNKTISLLPRRKKYFILRYLICNSLLWDLIYVKINVLIWMFYYK